MSGLSLPIVILGCRVISTPALCGALARRVRTAARVFEARSVDAESAPWVFVSGGKRWAGVSEAHAMFTELTHLGVPATRITLEASSMSTRENAARTAGLLHARDMREISLVTCDFHMQRASRLFQSYGLRVEEIPATTPHTQAVRGLTLRASERLKSWLDGLQRASVSAQFNSNTTRR